MNFKYRYNRRNKRPKFKTRIFEFHIPVSVQLYKKGMIDEKDTNLYYSCTGLMPNLCSQIALNEKTKTSTKSIL